MILAVLLRWTNDCANGALDALAAEPRRMIAQQMLAAALRVAAGQQDGARLDLGRMTVSTAPTVCWTDALAELPDDETTVLLALEDGEVCLGYHLGEGWCYETSETVGRPVTHWAEVPAAPQRRTAS